MPIFDEFNASFAPYTWSKGTFIFSYVKNIEMTMHIFVQVVFEYLYWFFTSNDLMT